MTSILSRGVVWLPENFLFLQGQTVYPAPWNVDDSPPKPNEDQSLGWWKSALEGIWVPEDCVGQNCHKSPDCPLSNSYVTQKQKFYFVEVIVIFESILLRAEANIK